MVILHEVAKKAEERSGPRFLTSPTQSEPEYIDDDGEGIVEAKDGVELPERPSTCGERGKGIVEAEEAV